MPRAKDVWLPLLVIHAAMMLAVISYGIMGYFVAEQPMTSAPPADHTTWLAILGGLAAVVAVLSFVVRARLMPPRERASDGRIVSDERLSTADARAALARLRTALIVAWGLSEAVAILGLISTFLFHDASDYAPFGAAALVLLVIHAPRPRLLVQIVGALPAGPS